MCSVFKQSRLLPCVMPIDQMKKYREKKEEDVGFHQCLADVFRHFCLSSLCFSIQEDQSSESTAMPALAAIKEKTLPPFPSLAVMCDTQLGYSPSCSPWAVHMSPICTPEKHSVPS